MTKQELDERIAASEELYKKGFVTFEKAVLHHCSDVLTAVTPEKADLVESLMIYGENHSHEEVTASVGAHNKAIDELEANAKELLR